MDLHALMAKAAEMVALAERYRAALAAQAQAQARPHRARAGAVIPCSVALDLGPRLASLMPKRRLRRHSACIHLGVHALSV